MNLDLNRNKIIFYIFLGLILHLISAYFTYGFYSDDEHFQILEPAAYLLGLNDVVIEDTAGANSAVFNTDGAVELYYRGTSAGKKFETTTSGVIVTGVTTSTTTVIVGSGVTISVAGVHASSGIVTASSFEGSGSALTGLPAGFNWVDGSLF